MLFSSCWERNEQVLKQKNFLKKVKFWKPNYWLNICLKIKSMRLVHGLYRASGRLQQILSMFERLLVYAQVSQGHRFWRQSKVLQLSERVRWQMRSLGQKSNLVYIISFFFFNFTRVRRFNTHRFVIFIMIYIDRNFSLGKIFKFYG